MKEIVKCFIISLLFLLVSSLTFYFAFAESNYQIQTYDLDLISLYLFYLLIFIRLIETVIRLKRTGRNRLQMHVVLFFDASDLVSLRQYQNKYEKNN